MPCPSENTGIDILNEQRKIINNSANKSSSELDVEMFKGKSCHFIDILTWFISEIQIFVIFVKLITIL